MASRAVVTNIKNGFPDVFETNCFKESVDDIRISHYPLWIWMKYPMNGIPQLLRTLGWQSSLGEFTFCCFDKPLHSISAITVTEQITFAIRSLSDFTKNIFSVFLW